MATPLIYKSLNWIDITQSSIFHRVIIVGWSSSLQKFYYEKKPLRIARWLISASMNFTNILLGIISFIFMCMGQMNVRNLIKKHIITSFILLLSFVTFFLNYLFYAYRLDLIVYLNAFLKFFPNLKKKTTQKFADHDLLGLMGITLVTLLTSVGIIFFITSGFKVVNCTMLPLFMDFLFPPSSEPSSLGFIFFKCLFSLFFHWEMGLEIITIIEICCIMIMYIANIHLRYLKIITDLTCTLLNNQGDCSVRLQNLLKTYQNLLVIHAVILKPASFILAIVMGFGFYILILSICLSIYGWNTLSPLVYPIFPFVMVVCVIILVASLPVAPRSIETSGKFIHLWSINSSQFKRGKKYLKKLFISLRPTEFHCGLVGVLDKDRATSYVASIMENSVTGLLLFGDLL